MAYSVRSEQVHQRVYGAGFHAGLRAAGVNEAPLQKGEAMNQARFQALLAGQNSLAKKVYSVVPISEAWAIPAISSELRRQNMTMEHRAVEGCLENLCNVGLVQKRSGGQFVRTPVRDKPPSPAATPAPEPAPEPAPPVAPEPSPEPPRVKAGVPRLDKLAALAERVRGMMADLQTLASDIETAALDIEEQFAANEADLCKIRQFKSLLNQIT